MAKAPADQLTSTTEIGQTMTLARVIHSEWIKFKTLRSSWAILVGAFFAMIGFGFIFAFNTRHLTANQQADDLGRSALLQGYYLTQLLVGSLGVLFVSSEFSTGQIRSSFNAVPKRLYILVSKLIVFFMITGVALLVASLVAFLGGQALISHYRTGYSLFNITSLRVVFGTSIYLTLIGLLGGAIGWIVRSTPGALVSFFALLLVVPVLFNLLFGNVGKDILKFLPSGAGGSFIGDPVEPGLLTNHLVGFIILLVWVIVTTMVAAVTLQRRDV